jgi:hypothetical protein
MGNNGPACEICGEDTDVNGIRYASYASTRIESFCQKCVGVGETAVKVRVCKQCNCESDEKTIFKVIKKPSKVDEKKLCIACGKEITTGGIRAISDGLKTVYECSECMSPAGGVPDVWYGYGSGTHTEENIAYPHGHPQAGQPIPFSSRRSKQEAMRIAGVQEAGDKVHGAPKSYGR